MSQSATTERWLLAAVGLAALGLRALYVHQIAASPFFDAPVVDAQAFLAQARQIAGGDLLAGREPFWQPPLYPYLLALFCWLSPGHLFGAVRLGQGLLGTASCLLVYLIGRQVAPRRVALLAAGMLAVYGPLIYFDGELLAVPLEVFLYLSLLLAILRALRDGRAWSWAAVGVLGGLAALTRPNILLFIGACLLLLPWLEGRPLHPVPVRHLVRRALLVGVPLLLTIAPVTARNWLVGRDPVLISANGGVNFYIGNNAAYDSTVAIHPGMHWENLVMQPVQAGFRSASDRSAFFYRKGMDFVLAHPLAYGGLMLKKLWLFWSGPEIKRNQDMYYARQDSWLLATLLWDRVVAFPFGLVGPLSLVGLALTWGRGDRRVAVLRLFVLAYTASVLLFFVTDRYRAPVVPVLLIFAAWALAELGERWRAGGPRSLVVPGVALAGLVIVLNLRSAPDPTHDPQLHHDLGEVYLRKQEYERSITHSRRALELEEAYPSAHHNLAVAYLSEERYPEALAHARRALELQPPRADTRVVLAQALMALGSDAEAAQRLQEALRIQPDLGSAHYYYGRLLLRQRRYAQALPHLLAGLRWQPTDFWTCYEVGLAYQGSGQIDDALEYFERARRLDPRRPEAANAAGAMYRMRGDGDRARACFTEALALAPDNPEALTNLGLLELQAGRFAAAILLLERALPGARSPDPVLQALQQAYLATGQEDRAGWAGQQLAAPTPP